MDSVREKLMFMEEEIHIMNTGTIIFLIICILIVCCSITHRRVIKALINHEPMPKAPKWHCWVKQENRRS